jgi:hypothetical protein
MNIQINHKYDHLKEYIESIPAVFEAEGEYIYGGRRNLIKLFIAPDGTKLNVKRYHVPGGLNKIIYSFNLRKPKGQRAFDYPAILLSKGIDTPEAVAYMEERHGKLLGLSYLVTIQCPFDKNLYQFGNAKEGEYEDMAVALAHFTAKMHDNEVLHRDFSPGNILWTNGEEGAFMFSIVDINRMFFGKVGITLGCKNFARLWGPKQFFIIMAHEYAKARGLDEDSCERLVLMFRANFWKRYSRKHDVDFEIEY